MNKIYLIIFIAIIGIFGIIVIPFLNTPTQKIMDSNHIKQISEENAPAKVTATFTIITNGITRNFDNSMYHNLSADAYISPENTGEAIIIGEKTWDDFFKTLPFELNKGCLTTGTGQKYCTNDTKRLKFILNGNEDQNALDKVINQDDELIVEYTKL